MKNNTNFSRFERLPLGMIKPKGWLKDQLQIQADGMTGHLEENWADVGPDSAWLSGTGESWERGPYYLDGLIPLAYLLNDKKLLAKSQKWIESILTSQTESGWFGPKNKDWWSRMIVLKVLIQYYEVTHDGRVIPFLINYAHYQKEHLEAEPLSEWGKARGGENILSLLWLYNQTKESFLLEVIDLLKKQTFDWPALYQNYPFKRYVTEFSHESHVVNVAMSLKYFGLYFELTGEDKYKILLENALKTLDLYHGQLHGMVSGDEWLAGTHPSQGTELCSIVEYMYSMETLLAVYGGSAFGDRLERVAFNALPAAISRDWFSHQYDQQVNQICCSKAKRNWTENNDEANLFGLEPHFGCCTANMHQGWPKFTSHLWMKDSQSYVCQSIVPCKVTTEKLTVLVEGNYPFITGGTLKVKAKEAYTLKVRIPNWSKEVIFRKNNVQQHPIVREDYLFIEGDSGADVYTLFFVAEVKKEQRAQRAIGITYGSLIFSLPIKEEWKILKGNSPFYDWSVKPKSEWRYALSENSAYSVHYHKQNEKQIFDSRHSPISIITSGWKTPNWKIHQNSADTPPYQVMSEERSELTLVPYGGAKLRISEFPTIDRSLLNN